MSGHWLDSCEFFSLTAAVIYVRPVQKKTAVVLYNWYSKESITSVLQQQQKRGSFYAMVVMVSYTCTGASSSIFAKPLL